MVIDPTIGEPLWNYNTWLHNFSETEIDTPFNLDDAKYSEKATEVLANLKKDGTYDTLIETLDGATAHKLYSWIITPHSFPRLSDSPDFDQFLSEFIPYYVMAKNSWTPNQVAVEVKHYAEMEVCQFEGPRTKKCEHCGWDLSDDFAVNLTADAILDNTKVLCVCPHCHHKNYFSTGF